MSITTARPTDHRNLDLRQLNLDVAFGRSQDRIIWQPRILCWFADRAWAGESLGRYEGMSPTEVYRDLGCSNRVYESYNPCFVREEPPSIVRREEYPDDVRLVEIVDTPVGSISMVRRSTPTSRPRIVEKRWIETPEDMRIATWALDNSGWAWDQESYERASSEWGNIGAPAMYMPRVNVQDLYINTMGVEAAVYALYEWGSVVDDYFRALHENHLRMIDVINRSPIMMVNFGDNLHCSTLSPDLYEKYVLPAYVERCDKLHSAGKFVSSHWDGDTKSLLKYARVSGLDGIEAVTPRPQGDVTLEEIKDALGDDVFLIDGIPAVLFDSIFPEEELVSCTHRIIKLFAPKLILGISDEISSTGDIERVRTVGKIVDDYNASKA